jgi:hypothetical protein
MTELITYHIGTSIITGTVCDRDEGGAERFCAFSIPRTSVTNPVTDEKVATAVGAAILN